MEKTLKCCKGLLISIILFALFTAIFGLLLKFTGLPEQFSWIYLLIALTAANAFMGLYAGNLFQRKGLLIGAFFGVLVIAIILLITALCFSAGVSAGIFLPWYLIPVGVSALFGAIGTNLKN